MSFAQIEQLVGRLPTSAHVQVRWWQNASGAGPQTWRAAGWHVQSLDLKARQVTFARNKDMSDPPITSAASSAASQGDTRALVEREDSSWRITVLALFGVTAVLAGLTILGYSHTSTSSHLSPTDIFTDLSGAGTLIGGVAAMLVFVTGYRDRRKRKKQQADTEVLNNAIKHIGHSLRPEDIRALADLALALNGNQDGTRAIEAAARTNEQPEIGQSNDSATTAAEGREK